MAELRSVEFDVVPNASWRYSWFVDYSMGCSLTILIEGPRLIHITGIYTCYFSLTMVVSPINLIFNLWCSLVCDCW